MPAQTDPIVEEVRDAGAKLCRQAGNDLQKFCQYLRKAERTHASRLVRRAPVRLATRPGTQNK